MKKSFLSIVLTMFLIAVFPTNWFWYFEYKFRCEISGTSIWISLDGWVLCFDFLENINAEITPLKKDIENAQIFVDQWVDVEYWKGIQSSLQSNMDILEQQQNVIITSMADYERTLFARVKELLTNPITSEKKHLLSRVNMLRETMEITKKQWAEDTYKLIVNKMEVFQYRLFVLDRMLFATDFEEIVPFVKQYLSWDNI